ncbi:MAG: T9SS type A sorting domain-containing protein [Candidatus Cloacimonetes bacterium]|nr:T9SS type A sorting domain-containing protein [Candidatus Cloacimonadota bacterium]
MKRVITIIALLLPLLLVADFAQTYDVQSPDVRGRRLEVNLPVVLEAGQPALPFVPVRLLLPAGEQLTGVSVSLSDAETITGVRIDYSRAPQPISMPRPDNTQPDPAIYGVDAFWPSPLFRELGAQRKQGYDMVLLNVFPYRWNPVREELVWSSSFTIEVRTTSSRALLDEQRRMIRTDEKALRGVRQLIDNPSMLDTYRNLTSMSGGRDPDGPYTMIIITDAARVSWFDEFVDWKLARGISAGVFTTEWIYGEYAGDDNADAVRNFIIDAYTCYAGTGTPLEYVLLGGDDEIVPERGCFGQVGNNIDNRIPCDMYYSNLDGDWNGNGNGIYGEPSDNPDMLPEVAIGRISAETQSEFQNVFDKNYHYADEPSYANDIAFMLGENLNNNPLTWGGDYKDEIIPYIPDDFHVYTRYEREDTFSGQAVKDAINGGMAIINHMGHSNSGIVFGLTNSSVSALINTEYGFAYSQGCLPAAFDERTSQVGECVAENLTNSAHGLYAFVGNTRYGWYAPGSTNGASQYYDHTFFEALFDYDIRRLGDANNFSKEMLVNQALSSGVMRWVYYELMVMGDPTATVKDATGDYPYIVTAGVTYDDTQGDGDGILNPGETVDIYLQLHNLDGWANAPLVEATISCDDSTIQIVTATANYGAIPEGGTATNATPFVIIVPEDCNYDSYAYQATITAQSSTATFIKTYDLSFDVGLFQSGWPWASGQQFRAAPILHDLDGDSNLDVLAVSINGTLTGLDIAAQPFSGYPINHEENLWRSAAFADLNGDDVPEVVWASRMGAMGAWSLDGTELFRYDDCTDLLITPVVADVDGDGFFEVISIGLDGQLYVLSHEGDLQAGFPVQIGTVASDICASDLDDDGAAEILLGDLDGNLHAIRGDGSSFDNFPLSFDAGVGAGPISLGNGRIVLGTQDNSLQIVSYEGELLSALALEGRIAGSAIAADFVPGHGAEIAFATQNGRLYICNQYGSPLPGWPVNIGGTILYPPLAADIDGDGEVELIQFTGLSNLYVFNADASEVAFSPVPVNLVGNTPASIADMDGDGDAEIVCGVSSGALIIDCKLPLGEDMPWTTFRGNLRRTACYTDMNTNPAGDDELAPLRTELTGNHPNPFNPTTTIAFSLAKPSHSTLCVYNIRGQLVRTLVNGYRAEGSHSVVWQGDDDNGRPVASGVYFSRLRAGGVSDVRKMLLLK